MSKINIQGIVDDIKGQSVYAPLLEAVVNSIQAIEQGKVRNGKVLLLFERAGELEYDGDALPEVKSIRVIDNGAGFNERNRESFDTYRGDWKKNIGGKGFGRFMYLKFFNSVKVQSIFKSNGQGFMERKFRFGNQLSIIENESFESVENTHNENFTTLFLTGLKDGYHYEKQLETIGRKLLESLLIFFVDPDFECPEIILEEADGSNSLSLNKMLNDKKEIQLIKTKPFTLKSEDKKEEFTLKVFKVFYSKKKSRVSLAAQKREVTDTPIHKYVPEFEDEFFEEVTVGEKITQKNFTIKAYVIGNYLTDNVSLERDKFDFGVDSPDIYYPFSQKDIESKAAEIVKGLFTEEVKVRSDRKKEQIFKHVNESAPWHKPYVKDVDISGFSYNATPEKIELELQHYKLNREIQTRQEIKEILSDPDLDYGERLETVLENVTQMGKSDLAHYVSNRKVIIDIFDMLRQRRDDGTAKLEKDIHNLIFPMGEDSNDVLYEEHNLWLLDERLVFTDYTASDKKIGKGALGEPDLVVFDTKKAFRAGDNNFSNPLTVFEFKRPKRINYTPADDPIIQIAQYVKDIRSGKYETPDGAEVVKVNDNTPVYGYVVADLTDKIKQFAMNHSLTPSPDGEGFFGYHSGHRIYFEVISFKKLIEDAKLRNKIFFKKLHIE